MELNLAALPVGRDSQSPSRFLIVVFLLMATVFGVYAPSLQYHFILDDHRFTSDPRVQSEGHIWEYFTNYVWAQFTGGPTSFYRPLFVLWMRINFIFSGMSPWGWHLLSILKHLAVAILLYLLVYKLLRDPIAGFLAAALFALHPAQTESVAWVTVPDPLTAIGVLSTLLLFLNYAKGASPAEPAKKPKKKMPKSTTPANISRSPRPWLFASAAICFLTLLTKETAIILPVVIFFLSLLMLRASADSGAAGNAAANFLARFLSALRLNWPFACATVLYLLLRLNAFDGKLGSLTQHLPWRSILLSLPSILWFYIKVLLWPVRSYAYADPTIAEKFSARGVLLPGLAVAFFVVALTVALLWLTRKAQRDLPAAQATGVEYLLLIGSLLLLLPILPALNLNVLNPGDFLHGRYVYLSLLGFTMLVAAAWHLAGNARKPLLWAAGSLAIVFALLTLSQEKLWHDDLTLFTAGHQLAPNNPWVALNLERANVQVALEQVQQGRCSEVLPIFERVSREYPQEWSAWAGLGYCYFTLNNLPKAEESLHRAAQLSKEPRTIQLWQELRAQMGLPPPAPLE